MARAPGRTKAGVLNVAARALEYGARLVVGFVVNPILVGALGSFGFGAWQVLTRLLRFAGPATGRPGQALRWTLANRQSSTDYDEKRRYVGSAVLVWLMFLPIMLVLGVPLVWFAPTWLKASPALVAPVRLAAAVLVLNLIIASLGQLPRSALEGENLGYKCMGWSASFIVLGGGLTVLALHLEMGLVGVAWATLATSVVIGVAYLQITRIWVPWFGIRKPLPGAVRRFLGLSGWFLGWNGVMALTRASDVVLLGTFASVELVTDYTLMKYAPETLISMVAMFTFGVMPGLGGVIGAGDVSKAVQIRQEIMSFSWWLLIAAGTPIILWNQSFVTLWVGAEFAAGPITTLLIVLLFVQFALQRNDAGIIDLTLNLRAKVLLGLLSAILAIAFGWFLITEWNAGIVGLCVGFILGRCVITVAYPWIVGRHLGIPVSHQLRGLVRPSLVTVALFGSALWLSRLFQVRGWFQLVGAVGATLALASIVAFYAGLSARSRGQLVNRIRIVADSARPPAQ